MNKKTIPVLCGLFFLYATSFSQGCSDAGFCTMGSLKSTMHGDSSYQYLSRVSFVYGSGEQKTKHLDVIPEIEISLFKNNLLQVKIPFLIVSGNLNDNSGLGDALVSFIQTFGINDQSQVNVTIGAKLPTGTTNAKGLPMPYQTGLGTTDLIVGASYQYNKWKISTGYQKVISNGNENGFLHTTSSSDLELAYFESNLLVRGDDALIRIDRKFSSDQLKFVAGLLSIFRLQEDKITNASGQQVSLAGSDGLTLNVTGGAEYALSKMSQLNFLFGIPVVVREVRADGLTRKFVLSASYQIRFGK